MSAPSRTLWFFWLVSVVALGTTTTSVSQAQSDHGPATSSFDYRALRVGDTYVSKVGELRRIVGTDGQSVILSHKPGCERDPDIKGGEPYRPLSGPGCREEVPGPFFVVPEAPPFQYPPAAPQTHGLDLGVINEATSKAYFKWLCDNEAGDWIYKAVRNVDGFFAMRNRDSSDFPNLNGWPLTDRYYVEDPWGQIWNRIPNSAVVPALKTGHWSRSDKLLPNGPFALGGFSTMAVQDGFEFFERPLTREEQQKYKGFRFARYQRPWPADAKFASDLKDVAPNPRIEERYRRKPGEVWMLVPDTRRVAIHDIPLEPTNEIRSRYGFFWRGIERTPQDRLHGIAGTEDFVIDMQTNEILSLKRSFVRALYNSKPPGTTTSWEWREECPSSATWRLAYKGVLIPRDPFSAGDKDLTRLPGPYEDPALFRTISAPNL
ncbi:MAG: hypothetical protein QM776_07955 [Rhodocyclaceae bacterium]